MDLDWPILTKDLARMLGVSEGRIRGIKSKDSDQFTQGVDFEIVKAKPYSPGNVAWTKEGAIKVAQFLPTSKAVDFLEKLNIVKLNRIKPEHYFLDIITASLEGITSHRRQFAISGYRVDLYLPDLKIVIVLWRMHCEDAARPRALKAPGHFYDLKPVLFERLGDPSPDVNTRKEILMSFFWECVELARLWRRQGVLRFDTRYIHGRHLPYWYRRKMAEGAKNYSTVWVEQVAGGNVSAIH